MKDYSIEKNDCGLMIDGLILFNNLVYKKEYFIVIYSTLIQSNPSKSSIIIHLKKKKVKINLKKKKHLYKFSMCITCLNYFFSLK